MTSLFVIHLESCGKNCASSMTSDTILLKVFFLICTIPQHGVWNSHSSKTKHTVYLNLVTIRRRLRLSWLKYMRKLLLTFFGDDINYSMAQTAFCMSIWSISAMLLHFVYPPLFLITQNMFTEQCVCSNGSSLAFGWFQYIHLLLVPLPYGSEDCRVHCQSLHPIDRFHHAPVCRATRVS